MRIQATFHSLLLLLFSNFVFGAGNDPLKNKLSNDPLRFIENKGQLTASDNSSCSDVLFYGNAAGVDVFLRKGGVTYVLSEFEKDVDPNINSEVLTEKKYNRRTELLKSKQIQRVDLDFVSANRNAKRKVDGRFSQKYNYYLAHCPSGITGVEAFAAVTYEAIYKNIDVSFYGNKAEGLEYDFIVKQGGDPNDIQLKYSGAEKIRLSPEGKLLIETRLGELSEWIPSTYQIIEGKKKQVGSKYELNGTTIKFLVGEYDKSQPLIIDPWCTWITYLGGTANDEPWGISTDSVGNIATTGVTYSTTFPVLLGFQSTNAGFTDAYLSKFDVYGNLLWSTYFGGSDYDYSLAVACGKNGDVAIAGSTVSFDLPVLSGFQMSHTISTLNDVLLAKFDSTGARVWATYYGGSNEDVAYGVHIDNSGNVLITGETLSINFPVLAGFQMTKSSIEDAFVVKFNSIGTRLWGTFYGGNAEDRGNGIAADRNGNVYFTGYTQSTTFPVLAGFQMTASASSNAILVKFNPTGIRLWATYCGGTGAEVANAVAVDTIGNVMITGTTNSLDFPVFSGSQMVYGGGVYDAYVMKFSGAGPRVWGTYFGGIDREESEGIAVDENGNTYFAGMTYGANLPVTPGACQPASGGNSDVFFASLDSLSNRKCSTYMGGTFGDASNSLAISGAYAYMTGPASPGTFPVTPGSFQTVPAGGADAFVAQIPKDCSCSTNLVAYTVAGSACASVCTATASANTSCGTPPFSFLWSDGQTTQTAVSLCPGTYTVTVTDAASTVAIATATVIVHPSPNANITGSSGICFGQSSMLNGSGSGDYLWSTGDTSASISVTPLANATYTLTVTNAFGCADTTIHSIAVNPLPVAGISANASICYGENDTLTASGGTTFLWNTGQSTAGIVVSPSSDSTFSVIVTDSLGCADTVSQVITVNALPVVSITADGYICAGQNDTLFGSGGGSYLWSNGDTLSNIIVNPSSNTTYTLIAANVYGCTDTASQLITVNPLPTAAISGNSSICIGQNDTLTGTGGSIYLWNMGATTSTIVVSPSVTSTYSLMITDATGCSDTSSFTVLVDTLPVLIISGDLTICNGASTNLLATGGSAYTWSPPAGLSCTACANPTVDPVLTTTYTITASSGMCTGTQTVTVLVEEPVDTFALRISFCPGDSAALLFAPAGSNSPYQWLYAGAALAGANSDSILIDPAQLVAYSLQWTNNGCAMNTSSVNITPRFFNSYLLSSNVFSPNGDNKNDKFFPFISPNISKDQLYGYVTDFKFQILNRWGQSVFTTEDPLKEWDGKTQVGMAASEDVYYWIVSYVFRCAESNEPVLVKGFVHLVR